MVDYHCKFPLYTIAEVQEPSTGFASLFIVACKNLWII
jgi:hypothetical protein